MEIKRQKFVPALLTITIAIALPIAGCDVKPEHYYVMCDNVDARGWKLVNIERQDGYLMSCTYQSPDRKFSETLRCTDRGCD
jgi:major membrane immunogen (membrane-anchored lipoprotein)